MNKKLLIWEREPCGYVIEFSPGTSKEEIGKELKGYKIIENTDLIYVVTKEEETT